jgi:GNAT superfamily N-acetyltransferase
MSASTIETMHVKTIPSATTSPSRLKAAWFQNDPLADGLDFGLATDRPTLEQAFRLQHDQYVAQGYMDAHPSGWRLSLHNALSATRVFVARCGGRVVGTMTLIADSPLGLPMDEIYTDELRSLRNGRGNHLAEVSALAMDPEYQSSGVPILLRMIRMLVIYAAQTVSDLCITVNPHHAAFYRKAFHFQEIGGLKQYGKVNGAPAIALRLDLALARSLMRELRDGHRMISKVYEFLFHPATVETVMTRLGNDARRVIPLEERVEHFFSRHEAWTQASDADRAYILAGCDIHSPDHSNRRNSLRLAMA